MNAASSTPKSSWEALYQQNPFVVGGGIFPIEKLTTWPILDRTKILKSVRYWDKAGTESDDAAFTAGALIHMLKDNRFVIEHVVRGQWSALDREEKIKFWAERDRANSRPGAYEVGVEQEPGSGGPELRVIYKGSRLARSYRESSSLTAANWAIAKSTSSGVCAADSWVRIRA